MRKRNEFKIEPIRGYIIGLIILIIFFLIGVIFFNNYFEFDISDEYNNSNITKTVTKFGPITFICTIAGFFIYKIYIISTMTKLCEEKGIKDEALLIECVNKYPENKYSQIYEVKYDYKNDNDEKCRTNLEISKAQADLLKALKEIPIKRYDSYAIIDFDRLDEALNPNEIKQEEKTITAYCLNCGAKLPDNYKFCPSCGTKINDEKSDDLSQDNIEASAQIDESDKFLENLFKDNNYL